jgi:hypothetical protein
MDANGQKEIAREMTMAEIAFTPKLNGGRRVRYFVDGRSGGRSAVAAIWRECWVL